MWLLAKTLSKHRTGVVVSAIIVILLVPYFLFQTNFAYEVTGSQSWSVPLSGYRMDPIQLYGFYGYIDGYSVYGARWISADVPYQYNIFADNALFTSLTAYGLVYRGYVGELTNTTTFKGGEFAFLSYISINYEPETSNGTLPRLLNQTDVVYSNGNSEVYYIPLF
jgi:hypothetical protein